MRSGGGSAKERSETRRMCADAVRGSQIWLLQRGAAVGGEQKVTGSDRCAIRIVKNFARAVRTENFGRIREAGKWTRTRLGAVPVRGGRGYGVQSGVVPKRGAGGLDGDNSTLSIKVQSARRSVEKHTHDAVSPGRAVTRG